MNIKDELYFIKSLILALVGTFKIRDDKVVEDTLKTALKVGYRLIGKFQIFYPTAAFNQIINNMEN